jgi:hypothetical protein
VETVAVKYCVRSVSQETQVAQKKYLFQLGTAHLRAYTAHARAARWAAAASSLQVETSSFWFAL